MKNAFIIHGTGGHPKENWFPWLREKLERLDYKVIIPQFPTPENQTPETWFQVMDQYRDQMNGETIMIAHSLGGAFLLRVLERYDVKVRAAYIVAAPIGVKPIKYYDTDFPYIGDPFDWEKILSHAGLFRVFHSDNDPLVCIGNGEQLAANLETTLTLVPNSGHFNAAAGYTKFDLLFDTIRKDL